MLTGLLVWEDVGTCGGKKFPQAPKTSIPNNPTPALRSIALPLDDDAASIQKIYVLVNTCCGVTGLQAIKD